MISEEIIESILKEKKRLDGREFTEYRKIEIEKNIVPKAEGSAGVRMGNTYVIAGVKIELAQPFPDNPNEGILIVNAEFPPIAHSTFEPGPPNEYAIELARLVDRLIRESKMIDLEKLFIEEGKVYGVFVDLHVISNDGNLLDASALASIAALCNTKVPKYENGNLNRNEFVFSLPTKYKPIYVTIGKVENEYILDLTYDEEQVVKNQIAFGIRDDDIIVSAQKLKGTFKFNEIEKLIDLAIEKSKELRKLI
ncbi:MAG: exosome complex protein Rrp42 [Candidatus Aenigmatarchaeota archaeon]